MRLPLLLLFPLPLLFLLLVLLLLVVLEDAGVPDADPRLLLRGRAEAGVQESQVVRLPLPHAGAGLPAGQERADFHGGAVW